MTVQSKNSNKNVPSLLMIYTGGTIGMKLDEKSNSLVPFNISQIEEQVPEIKRFGYKIDKYSFPKIVDSSDITPEFWVHLANVILDNYSKYDGFVVLHGTDTMSYTASALSFMLKNLEKPVIFTGSQLPVGMLRTDGKENIISSIEIAAAVREDGRPMVPEVCIYFESELFRGNRTTKYNAEHFKAFRSENFPPLAQAGVHIKYNKHLIRYPKRWGKSLEIRDKLDTNVAILKLFPGITHSAVSAVLGSAGCRAVILQTYGAGNAPTKKEFLDELKAASERGVILVNVSQCPAGKIDMKAYATGVGLENLGVISGYDATFESIIAKLFVLLGTYSSNERVKAELQKEICGEVTI